MPVVREASPCISVAPQTAKALGLNDKRTFRTGELSDVPHLGKDSAGRTLKAGGKKPRQTTAKEGTKGKRGDTALHAAAANGRVQIIELLLTSPKININNHADSDGFTPLMRICEAAGPCIDVTEDQRLACAQLLIEAQCDVNALNYAGHSALHVAFHARQSALADLLLATGEVLVMCSGRRCKRCELNMKIRERERQKELDQRESEDAKLLALEAAAEERSAVEAALSVIDFERELEAMKAEMGSILLASCEGSCGENADTPSRNRSSKKKKKR